MAMKCLLSHLIKQNSLLKKFLRTLNLDNSSNSLPAFLSRTNLKLRNIPVILILVTKVISDFDSPKASATHCIPVVVVENHELERSYILT